MPWYRVDVETLGIAHQMVEAKDPAHATSIARRRPEDFEVDHLEIDFPTAVVTELFSDDGQPPT